MRELYSEWFDIRDGAPSYGLVIRFNAQTMGYIRRLKFGIHGLSRSGIRNSFPQAGQRFIKPLETGRSPIFVLGRLLLLERIEASNSLTKSLTLLDG